jgi:DNA invertase Pin-like site-specific DNA recombinase
MVFCMSKHSRSKGAPQLESPETPKGELIGYARVSTVDQNLELQTRALTAAGVTKDHLYEEKLSGAKKNRPELDLAIKDLRPGDTLVVWRLDRLSRSMHDLYTRLAQIREQGASFRSLTENFDFNTATGQLILGMIALMAQFERQLTIERTSAGMAVLREKGHRLGAVVKFTEAKKRLALKMLAMKERRSVRGKMLWRKKYTRAQVAKALKISNQTLYLYLREREAD